MAEKAAEWEKKVVDAEKHASKVYEDEIARLEKQVEHTDKAEAREVKRVEREVALDAAFAKHHIEYLEKVVLHEAKRVDHAYAVMTQRFQNCFNNMRRVQTGFVILFLGTVLVLKHVRQTERT